MASHVTRSARIADGYLKLVKEFPLVGATEALVAAANARRRGFHSHQSALRA